ncbi:MAG: hypothetical protein EBS97_03595 [Verrucomicrobia bacterium]|nr:hypothetical protein [Verrucomicrobiota bacterium]
MCRWGVRISLVIFVTHSLWADDAANPHPLSQPPSPLANPNAELVDQPLPGAKPDIKGSEGGSLSNPNEEANALTPFYVRTGIGLSFVTTVDYPDFGISGDVPMQPGFATGLMLGAQFHKNIAFEIEGGLLYNSVFQNQLTGISATDLSQVTNIQLFQVPMMGNFIFRTDPLADTKIRLVAGGGMGGIFRQVFITGSPNDVTRSQTLSAFQGFGGIQINPGEPDLMVDVQFRYLNSIDGQSVPSMSIMGTVTIRF